MFWTPKKNRVEIRFMSKETPIVFMKTDTYCFRVDKVCTRKSKKQKQKQKPNAKAKANAKANAKAKAKAKGYR